MTYSPFACENFLFLYLPHFPLRTQSAQSGELRTGNGVDEGYGRSSQYEAVNGIKGELDRVETVEADAPAYYWAQSTGEARLQAAARGVGRDT